MDITCLVTLVGYATLLCILSKCLRLSWTLFRCYALTSVGFVKDLKKYGEWAVVTGSSDGIGKEYAKQLAKQGFNVVLISRTKSKLEKVAKEIEDEFHVKTKIICFDFCKTTGYENIESEISHLDIGILVNNVGWADTTITKFIDRSIDRMDDMSHINIFSTVHMTHMVLKGMVQRKRGAIVHVAAGSVYIDSLPFPIYVATKQFVQKFVKSLQLEYSGLIDHQLVLPFGVSTNLLDEKPSISVASAKRYVEGAVAAIGITDVTHGYYFHEVMAFVLQLMPQCIIKMLIQKYVLKSFKME